MLPKPTSRRCARPSLVASCAADVAALLELELLELELPEFFAATLIENAGSDAVVLPSLTVMMMLLYVPTAALGGVPQIFPVAVLKVIQLGLF